MHFASARSPGIFNFYEHVELEDNWRFVLIRCWRERALKHYLFFYIFLGALNGEERKLNIYA